MLVGGAWDRGSPRGRAPGRPGGSTGGGWRSSPPPPTRSIPLRTWNYLLRACPPASARRGPPPRSPPPAPVPRGGVPPASYPWGLTPTGRGGNSPRPPVWASSSHHSGAGLSNGCSRIAARLRDDGADHATAEAERAGVLIALPMTLCYLPAFFLLGLAPMVISLGTSILSSH